jgi:hypothetical protein
MKFQSDKFHQIRTILNDSRCLMPKVSNSRYSVLGSTVSKPKRLNKCDGKKIYFVLFGSTTLVCSIQNDDSQFVRHNYVGDLKHGKRHGHGTQLYPSNDKYDGEWKNDLREGYGRMICSSGGDSYVGNWKNDQKSGIGTLRKSSTSYEYYGHFRKNKKHGYGTEKIGSLAAMDMQYKGFWKNDQKHGKGIEMDNMTGNHYKGDWKNDLKHGYGICQFENGDCYVGEWRNGEMTGKGIMKYVNSLSYSDDESDDGADGMGDGLMIYCEWKNGKPYGFGLLLSSDGTEIVVEWCNGRFKML